MRFLTGTRFGPHRRERRTPVPTVTDRINLGGVPAPQYDNYLFPEPWWDLRGHDPLLCRQREAMAKELSIELGPGHPLWAALIETIAMFTRQDEVLFRIDGQFQMVHLTWARRADRSVRLRPLPDWPATVDHIREMAENW